MGAGIGTLALAGAIAATPTAALAQDDELATANTWVTDQIQADGAWETTQGEDVTVAVVDTGMSEHPYFEDKSVERGYSIFSEEEDAWNDQDGHGTAVAAMVLSVAPAATILPVRDGTGADLSTQGLTGGVGGETEVEAIRWAVDNGADVMVMSWGVFGGEPRPEFTEAIQYALDSGTVVVAAAGNEPDGEIPYPASIPGVVAVSGTDQSGNSWSESTTGPEVVVAAPASEMTVPKLQEESLGWGDDPEQELYETSRGTSLATGLVGGTVALMLASDSDMDGNNAVNRLIQTSGDGGGDNRTEVFGYGVVNADQAVNAEGIETVDENPLGYPLGGPGASGADSGDENAGATEGEPEGGGPSAAAAEKSGTGISTVIIVAAATVLLGAAVVVWLVLRGRSRKSVPSTSDSPGAFVPGGEQFRSGYAPQEPHRPQYGAAPTPGSQYGGPPTGGQPNYSPPPNTGEPSPPWQAGDPNQRR
ncbi:S8 family serine peptidase [Glycomyces tarimensis]